MCRNHDFASGTPSIRRAASSASSRTENWASSNVSVISISSLFVAGQVVIASGRPKPWKASGLRRAVISSICVPRSREHFDAGGHKDVHLLVPDVGAECELPVRAGGYEAPALYACERPAAEEDGDLLGPRYEVGSG